MVTRYIKTLAVAVMVVLALASGPANALDNSNAKRLTLAAPTYGVSHNNYHSNGSTEYGPSHDNYNGTEKYTSGTQYSAHSHNDYGSSKQALSTSVPY